MAYDRHISLLTSFPKVFEQVIHERLLEILNDDDDDNSKFMNNLDLAKGHQQKRLLIG